MKSSKLLTATLVAAAFLFAATWARAQVDVQCPGDTNGDGVSDTAGIVCRHLSAGDGFQRMADGKHQYTFGFSDLTSLTDDQALQVGMLAANFPAPTIAVDEGDHFYLSLTNVGMVMRPDLFDPHTVHFHGFPQAASIFDGVPEASLAINQGATFTYYYKLVEPGTYMYHCHVEATEHMQMGMLGNLYVRPAQNRCGTAGHPACPTGQATGSKYVYNDGDGSTRYDVEYPIQIGSFDPDFHDASEAVQPLPFAPMRDRYPMLNGRGYPDTLLETVNSGTGSMELPDETGGKMWDPGEGPQPVHTHIRATAGQRLLLRISNLNVTRFNTLATLGLRMKVVGVNARLFRGPTGKTLYYTTSSVTLGGGESVDVIIDTTGVTPGTYILYSTNLNFLSNDTEDYGGMMTEIEIS